MGTELGLEADEYCVQITAVGAQAIAKMLAVNRALTSVNLLKNDLGDGAAAVVAAAKQHGKIKTLCGIAEGKTEVSVYAQSLILPNAVLLSFDLEFNRSLKYADFSANSIGDEGTAALSDALKANSTLETLELWTNKIGAAGAQSLADMLQVNRSLNSVDLRFNPIPDEGKQQLRDAVKGKNT